MIEIDGVELHLAKPIEMSHPWIGQSELIVQLMAAWSVIHESDIPLGPRLMGQPGVGKTSLAYEAASRLKKPVYIMQATIDTRPEDLIVAPVIAQDQTIKYAASPLVTAMLVGGVVILDEGNRMSEKSWASLAPLLDNRRYVESVVAGVRIAADPGFRFVTTMNQDSSTFELPEYIHSRLQPQIFVDFPQKEEEIAILKAHLPHLGNDQDLLEYIATFLQRAHVAGESYSVRDGINIARYAAKLARQADSEHPLYYIHQALKAIGGDNALNYVQPS